MHMGTPDHPRIDDNAPADLIAARDAYDAAVDALEDHELDNADLLAADWENRAAEADRVAATDAALQGKDDSKRKSAVEHARIQRPRAIGRRDALQQKVTEAARAVKAAAHDHAPAVAQRKADELRSAADEFRAAEEALRKAKADWVESLNSRIVWTEWAIGNEPTDGGRVNVPISLGPHRIGRDARGNTVESATVLVDNAEKALTAVYGAAYDASACDARPDNVDIRSLTNGSVTTARYDHAVYMVQSGKAELADTRVNADRFHADVADRRQYETRATQNGTRRAAIHRRIHGA